MDGDILTIAGLVGVTLFLSIGKWLNALRQWLLGFTVQANPLRILGEILTCTVSVGFVVGALWAISQAAPWSGVIVMGGFVSLAAYATDEGLALMDAGVRKLVGHGAPPAPFMMPPSQSEDSPKERVVEGPLTEDQAHAILAGKDADE